jgi:hypothetical protein
VDEIAASLPKLRSPLTGKEIMEILDMEPGPPVGLAKGALINAIVDGEIPPEKHAAREFIIDWWQGGGDRSS